MDDVNVESGISNKTGLDSKPIIIVSLIIFIITSIFNLYWLINRSNEIIPIFVFTIIMVITATLFINAILTLINQNKSLLELHYQNLLKSDKDTYLLMRKYYSSYDDKLDKFNEFDKNIINELVYNQKAAAKVTINMNKENIDAIMKSNDKMFERLVSVEKQIENNTDLIDTKIKLNFEEKFNELTDIISSNNSKINIPDQISYDDKFNELAKQQNDLIIKQNELNKEQIDLSNFVKNDIIKVLKREINDIKVNSDTEVLNKVKENNIEEYTNELLDDIPEYINNENEQLNEDNLEVIAPDEEKKEENILSELLDSLQDDIEEDFVDSDDIDNSDDISDTVDNLINNIQYVDNDENLETVPVNNEIIDTNLVNNEVLNDNLGVLDSETENILDDLLNGLGIDYDEDSNDNIVTEDMSIDELLDSLGQIDDNNVEDSKAEKADTKNIDIVEDDKEDNNTETELKEERKIAFDPADSNKKMTAEEIAALIESMD